MTYLPTILTILGALGGAFSTQIQALATAHPTATAILGGIVGVILHFLPSPTAAK